jgi:hypothetical protein
VALAERLADVVQERAEVERRAPASVMVGARRRRRLASASSPRAMRFKSATA